MIVWLESQLIILMLDKLLAVYAWLFYDQPINRPVRLQPKAWEPSTISQMNGISENQMDKSSTMKWNGNADPSQHPSAPHFFLSTLNSNTNQINERNLLIFFPCKHLNHFL